MNPSYSFCVALGKIFPFPVPFFTGNLHNFKSQMFRIFGQKCRSMGFNTRTGSLLFSRHRARFYIKFFEFHLGTVKITTRVREFSSTMKNYSFNIHPVTILYIIRHGLAFEKARGFEWRGCKRGRTNMGRAVWLASVAAATEVKQLAVQTLPGRERESTFFPIRSRVLFRWKPHLFFSSSSRTGWWSLTYKCKCLGADGSRQTWSVPTLLDYSASL